MKKSTIDRIVYNAAYNRNTMIGSYAYRADLNTGKIYRCKTDNVNRDWIDNNGRQYGAWVEIAKIGG